MRRRFPLLRQVITLGASLVVVSGLLLGLVKVERVVVAPGQLRGGVHPVRSAVAGLVAEVLVRTGETVGAGQPLVNLDRGPLDTEAARLRARIEAAGARIETLRAEAARRRGTAHPEEYSQACRDSVLARLELEKARIHHDLAAQLRGQELITVLELKDAEIALRQAELVGAEAERLLPRLIGRQRADLAALQTEMTARETELRADLADLELVRGRLAACTVTAPAAGVVQILDRARLIGSRLEAGDPLLTLVAAAPPRFEGVLSDHGLAHVVRGQPVRIRLSGYPWLLHGTLPGRVEFVAGTDGDGHGHPVVIACDTTWSGGPLRDGMKGQARIRIAERAALGRLILEKFAGREPS